MSFDNENGENSKETKKEETAEPGSAKVTATPGLTEITDLPPSKVPAPLVFMPSPFQDLPPVPKPAEESKTNVKKTYHFLVGSTAIPRVTGSKGEDAHFCCARALGVADGVSGWCQYGIDPAAFSQQLMSHCEERIEEAIGKGTGEIDPLEALTYAYSKVVAIGSSTATVVAINGGALNGLNLGDSGFVCFTKMGGEYVNRGVSKEQQHNFNTPFQLSRFPTVSDIAKLRGRVDECDINKLLLTLERKELCQDAPDCADNYTLQLHEDDILILGTDGTITGITDRRTLRQPVQGRDQEDRPRGDQGPRPSR